MTIREFMDSVCELALCGVISIDDDIVIHNMDTGDYYDFSVILIRADESFVIGFNDN